MVGMGEGRLSLAKSGLQVTTLLPQKAECRVNPFQKFLDLKSDGSIGGGGGAFMV